MMKHVGNTPFDARLDAVGLEGVGRAHWNLPPAKLILQTLLRGEGVLTSQGALAIETGEFTGRSPKDRFLVKDNSTASRVDWGDINQPMTSEAFHCLLSDVQRHLEGKSVFVKDAAIGSDERYRVPVRVVAEKAWSSLFVDNMFIRLTDEERWVADPEWHVICAPSFKADPTRHGCRQSNVSAIDFGRKTIVVAGSGYTGEIKKGMFSVMNYLLPVNHGVLPMHCSSNMGRDGDVAVFFGLSGTGKTTLSSDANRALIGDDEHGWTADGVFNMEGGCYAKTIDLSPEGEPEIYQAIKFGAMLENIGFEEDGITPNFEDDSITPNTRVSYPIDHIPGAVQGSKGGHPTDIFFLTCDAFGVLASFGPVGQRASHVSLPVGLHGQSGWNRSWSCGATNHIFCLFRSAILAIARDGIRPNARRQDDRTRCPHVVGQHGVDRWRLRRWPSHEIVAHASHDFGGTERRTRRGRDHHAPSVSTCCAGELQRGARRALGCQRHLERWRCLRRGCQRSGRTFLGQFHPL